MNNRYTYRATWSPDDGYYIAECLEFPSLKADAPSAPAAIKELEELVEFCIADMKKAGEPVPEPLSEREFSGRFVVRVPKELHRRITIWATEEGLSLNAYIVHKLENSTGSLLTRMETGAAGMAATKSKLKKKRA